MQTNALRLKGPIETTTLPRVVRDLWRARASGILHLTNGDATKRIIFLNGDIVFAGTNVEQERLGERLVRAGKIKRSVLALAFRVMERSHERFGKTMVEWGWMSPAEMQRWVAEQIKDIIYSVFTWSGGEYRFQRSEHPVDRDLVLGLQTAEVIYEGVQRIGDLAAVREGVGSTDSALRLVAGRRLGIPVTKEDGFVLSRADGRVTIAELVEASPLGEEETLRRVYGLLLAGVVKRVEPRGRKTPSTPPPPEVRRVSEDEQHFRDAIIARHAAMMFGNFYDRLGIAFGASPAAIEKAYEEVLASVEPAADYRANVSDLSKRLDDVKRKLVEAHEVLLDPEKRREYDRTLSGASSSATLADSGPRPSANTVAAKTIAPRTEPESSASEDEDKKRRDQAEFQFLEAQRCLKDGDYFDGIAALNEAIRLHPDKPEYHRLLGEQLAENPSCTEAALEHFERAIELDPEDEGSYMALAKLYEQEGYEQKASAVYEKLASVAPADGS